MTIRYRDLLECETSHLERLARALGIRLPIDALSYKHTLCMLISRHTDERRHLDGTVAA